MVIFNPLRHKTLEKLSFDLGKPKNLPDIIIRFEISKLSNLKIYNLFSYGISYNFKYFTVETIAKAIQAMSMR